jgi:hypothetical protein
VDKAYAGRARREEHRGLARGIAAAYDHCLPSLAGPRLQLRGRIVETCALEAVLLSN